MLMLAFLHVKASQTTTFMIASRDMDTEVSEPVQDLSKVRKSHSLLSSEDTIPSLLESVKQQKRRLENEIRATSGSHSSDVDKWIAQAKKVQKDIARCKSETAKIVEEHEQVRTLRSSAYDARNKIKLLEGEVAFTASLKEELQVIVAVKESLDEVQEVLNDQTAVEAASRLATIPARIAKLRSENAREILQERQSQLRHDAHRMLDVELATQVTFGAEATSESKESWVAFTQEDHTGRLLTAMRTLGTLETATESLTANIDRSLMQPLLSTNSTPSIIAEADEIRVKSIRSNHPLSNEFLLETLRQAVKFLYTHLPDLVVEQIGQELMPNVISTLIGTRLLIEIPTELSDVPTLRRIRDAVSAFANDLKSFRWPGHDELQHWVDQLPSIWLGKRKMASLNALRKGLSMTRGSTREVERIERQKISKQDVAAMNGDEWDAGWDEDAPERPDQNADDEASAWGFEDTDDKATEEVEPPKSVEDGDGADAWGWDDDNNAGEERKTRSPATQHKQPNTNANGNADTEQELTLIDRYIITDIPDHVLEIIGKDVRDSEEVAQPAYSALKGASPAAGLQAIPSHTLAMFRAMATTYYSTKLPSGNMHLYNDASYILQKLREAPRNNQAQPSAALEADCTIIERFARAAYAREMEQQRTILGDILDGAQGFQSCTKQPYAMQCETAVSSAVDRIRTMHAEWRLILSHSALLQSIGSLVSTVADKIMADILDMEDIEDPESQRLTSFCSQVSALDDLFISGKPLQGGETAEQEQDTVPHTFVYVPSWLRFQYLANILESSLVEIKYLWEQSELKMEFKAEEVVDLIRALFAETRQRRDAIAEIRLGES
jgi:centromere/kinetochore protein ZW10